MTHAVAHSNGTVTIARCGASLPLHPAVSTFWRSAVTCPPCLDSDVAFPKPPKAPKPPRRKTTAR